MAEIGKLLNGRYQLLEKIGSGGMSVVYRAQDSALGRIVAVKTLHENLTDDPDFLRRFQREAHSAANLSHPNVVTVHDIGQDGDTYYIVLEYVDGRTLKQLIRLQTEQGRPMPVGQALDIAIQVCSGIGYAHRAQLVHCDVKSQNMLVTREDRVKVADFGIAQAMSEATQHSVDAQIWGTPHYFSPEQAAGQSATPASDVYAIGVVLFELLTGRLPFTANTHTALALKHIHEPPPRASEFNPAVPAQLDQIILKVMAKEPAARYRTADQLGRILEAYRESTLQATSATSIAAIDPSLPVYEQETGIFAIPMIDQPEDQTSLPKQPPVTTSQQPVSPQYAPSVDVLFPAQTVIDQRDWTAITLGLLALVSMLGLIPLWYFVYQAYAG